MLAAFCVLLASPPELVESVRESLFDGYQQLMPRERKSAPATIVEIDEQTLKEYGQWPWPRTQVAALIENIAAGRPAAIGLDLLFPEPDRFSPGALLNSAFGISGPVARMLQGMPTNDQRLAETIRGRKVVLALAGMEAPDSRFPGAPISAPVRFAGGREPPLREFAGRLSSVDVVDQAAAGRGLISAYLSQRIVRRAPLLAKVNGAVVPGLSLEMLRVATGTRALAVKTLPGGLLEISLGDVRIPAQEDGSVWLRYSGHTPERFVSAATIFAGKADPDLLEGKLVLVGVTGLALLDYQVTPLDERVPGVELHAQLIEQMMDGAFLVRPAWARWVELLLAAGGGMLLIVLVPAGRVRRSLGALLALMLLAFGAGLLAFRFGGVLLDPLWPAAGFTLVFAALLAATLSEADRQRRALRESAARAAGELEAARRIQMGLLPSVRALSGPATGVELEALLEPARTVGGDFYDCFKLDRYRLFFVVGDVSGKGMPAALFMAVSKAILKAMSVRAGSDIGSIMMRAGREIGRDNAEQLFVTVFGGILDLRTGVLEFCNAGHEPPYLLGAGGKLARFGVAGGPPLCVLGDFAYVTEYQHLAAGDRLCVVTDGVTEAMNLRGELYGTQRLEQVLHSNADAGAAALAAAVRADVSRFVDGAVPSDDLTLLVLRWTGAPAAAAGEDDEEELADVDLDAPVAGLVDAVRSPD